MPLYSLLFLFIFIPLSFQSQFDLTLKQGINKEYYTPICFGTKTNQCLDLYIDLNSSYIWINSIDSNLKTKNSFNSNKSTTYNHIRKYKEHIIDNKNKLVGTLSEDKINFQNFSFDKLIFLLVNNYKNPQVQMEGRLGLGFIKDKEDNHYSLIGLLKQNNIIDDRLFNYQYINNDTAKISFGTVPSIVIDDYIHFGKCEVNRNDFEYDNDLSAVFHTNEYDLHWNYSKYEWSCNYTEVTLSSGDVIVKYESKNFERVKFTFQKNNIIIPMTFLLFLERTVFKNIINTGDCSIIKYPSNAYGFTCIKPFTQPEIDFNVLHINFGDWNFDIPLTFERIFELNNEQYYSIFTSNINEVDWSIGVSLLNESNIIYDLDNHLIGIYSKMVHYKDKSLAIQPKYKKTLYNTVLQFKIYGIIILSLIILLFGIFILFRAIRRIKKVKGIFKTKMTRIQLKENILH